MNIKSSKNSFANYFMMFVFVMLIPLQEWPDTSIHFERETIYSELFINIIQFFNLSYPKFIPSGDFSFFSDKFIYQTFTGDRVINLFKLIFIIPLFFIMNKFSSSLINKNLPFAPPFIFSLLASSLEPFAISLVVISFLYAKAGKVFVAILLGYLSTLIDRSMLPSFISIIVLCTYFAFNNKAKFYILISVLFYFIFTLYIISLSPIATLDPILNIYGITNEDIIYNAQFGQNNTYALMASLSGLYGWMSLRPFHWIVYYGIVLFCFALGFYKNSNSKKIEFLIFLIPTMIVLYLLPPLSQARYYPILILLFWENILLGAKTIFKKDEIFTFQVIIMTTLGLFLV